MYFYKLYLASILFVISIRFVNGQDTNPILQISVFSGYQQNNLQWSIAGNQDGQNPNVLSELKWMKTRGMIAKGNLQLKVWKQIYVTGTYSRSFTRSGTVNDMDYASDNRINPTYAGNFSNDKGFTNQWSAGTAFMLIDNRSFMLMPCIGYGIDRQSLYIIDHSGSFPALKSTYLTNWKGPYLGVTSSVQLIKKIKLAADVIYNQVNYGAVGNWNLINEFQHPVSYRHAAKGYGFNAAAKLVFYFTSFIAINIGGGYHNWQTGNGTDQLYLQTGQVAKTQLNGVSLSGFFLTGGFTGFFK